MAIGEPERIEDAIREEAKRQAKEELSAEAAAASVKPAPIAQVKREATTVSSQPLLGEDKKAAGEEAETEMGDDEIEEFKKGLKRKPTKGAGKKIRVKLGRLAFIVADVERGVYEWLHMNTPFFTSEEVTTRYKETYDDTGVVVDNRLNVESEYGDVINIGITLGAHMAQAAVRYYTSKVKRKGVDKSFKQEEGDGDDEGEEGEEEGGRFGNVLEEAKHWADLGSRKSADLTQSGD